MSTICVFGDSTTWGASDSEKGGWVERLKIYIGDNYNSEVYNLGISGDKTPDILERFESETRVRTEENEEAILIFAVGINDSYFVRSKNAVMTPPDEFKENIKKIINLAKKFSSKIIFVGEVKEAKPLSVVKAIF